MKKIYTFLVVASLSLFTLASCSEDDNVKKEEPKDVLLGKWDLKTVGLILSIDGEVVQEIEDQSVEGQLTMQFDFKEDKKVAYYIYQPASEESEEMKQEGVGTYEKKGSDLIITIDGEAQTFKIKANDATNLKLGLSEEFDYEGMLVKQDMTYNFTKM